MIGLSEPAANGAIVSGMSATEMSYFANFYQFEAYFSERAAVADYPLKRPMVRSVNWVGVWNGCGFVDWFCCEFSSELEVPL